MPVSGLRAECRPPHKEFKQGEEGLLVCDQIGVQVRDEGSTGQGTGKVMEGSRLRPSECLPCISNGY